MEYKTLYFLKIGCLELRNKIIIEAISELLKQLRKDQMGAF